jgi:hypothetical protein
LRCVARAHSERRNAALIILIILCKIFSGKRLAPTLASAELGANLANRSEVIRAGRRAEARREGTETPQTRNAKPKISPHVCVALVPRTRSSHASCCKSGCELRVQRGTRIIELLVSLRFRSSHQRSPQRLANFGIGTLAFRSLSLFSDPELALEQIVDDFRVGLAA